VEREPWLNYLHLFIEERGANSDELRRAIFSELPADVFSDSTRGSPNKPDSSASSGTSQHRNRVRDRGGGETKKQKVAASEAKALESMARRNAEQARLARVDNAIAEKSWRRRTKTRKDSKSNVTVCLQCNSVLIMNDTLSLQILLLHLLTLFLQALTLNTLLCIIMLSKMRLRELFQLIIRIRIHSVIRLPTEFNVRVHFPLDRIVWYLSNKISLFVMVLGQEYEGKGGRRKRTGGHFDGR
jgi:hypothetical protein